MKEYYEVYDEIKMVVIKGELNWVVEVRFELKKWDLIIIVLFLVWVSVFKGFFGIFLREMNFWCNMYV